MGALKESALLLEFADVFIGDDSGSLVDFGSVRNVTFTAIQNPIDILSDNRGSVVRKNRLNGSVAFDWLEAGDPDNLDSLMKGLVTKSIVAGTPVLGALQVIASPFVPNLFVVIENQNGDETKPTINSVTGSVDGALVEDDDFSIVQNAQGDWGIVMNTVAGGTTLTTLAQTITLDYDYTPNSSSRITGGTSKVSTPRFVKLVGPSVDDPLLTRTVVLESAFLDADAVLPFLDTEQAADVGVFPVVMTNEKDAVWFYEDEINPS